MIVGQFLNFCLLKATEDMSMHPTLRKIRNYQIEKLNNYTWNGQIAFCAQNYLFFCVTGWITIQNLRFEGYTFVEQLSSAISIVLVTFSAMFPFVIWAIYSYYLVKKDDQKFLFKRFGVLLDNVYGVRYQKYDIAI